MAAPPSPSTPPSTSTSTAAPVGGSSQNAGSSQNGGSSQNAGSILALLERSHESLLEACHSREVAERYLQAQLAALRAAAALVAARSVADHSTGPRSLWELVPAVAPELSEWADFFAISTGRRFRIERGQVAVTARDADDLLRQAETFLTLVARALGVPGAPPHGDLLSPTAYP